MISPTPKPPVAPHVRRLLKYITLADTLIVIGALILVLRWDKLGTPEIALVTLCGIGAVYLFIKGIRTIQAARKPQKPDEPQRWQPIEP
ncbi:MAG: hypothetical protein PHI18_08415 [bacterium]|nr:hypothetical protein [bacterium]